MPIYVSYNKLVGNSENKILFGRPLEAKFDPSHLQLTSHLFSGNNNDNNNNNNKNNNNSNNKNIY